MKAIELHYTCPICQGCRKYLSFKRSANFSGKYELAGSEFKIWPSNYDLELNLERKNKKLSSALPRQMIHIQIIIWAKF